MTSVQNDARCKRTNNLYLQVIEFDRKRIKITTTYHTESEYGIDPQVFEIDASDCDDYMPSAYLPVEDENGDCLMSVFYEIQEDKWYIFIDN